MFNVYNILPRSHHAPRNLAGACAKGHATKKQNGTVDKKRMNREKNYNFYFIPCLMNKQIHYNQKMAYKHAILFF